MRLARDVLKQLLRELGDWLDYEECPPVEWVVCGGAAMVLQGLQARTTRDVDVLGNWDPQGMEILGVDRFPVVLEACIERVVHDHVELQGFSIGWINLGPRKLVEFGLPDGFHERLTRIEFGTRLTLHLLGRTDLIALKLYAATDEFGDRQDVHVEDLEVLDPSHSEMEAAIEWMRGLPDFELRRMETKDVICRLGHDGLDYYV